MVLLHDKSLRDSDFMTVNESASKERMWCLLENKLVPPYVRNAIVRAAIQATYHTDTILASIGGTGASIASDGRRPGAEIDTPIDNLGDDDAAALIARGEHLAENDEELVVTDYNEAVQGSIPLIDRTWLGNRSKEELEGLSDIVKDLFYALYNSVYRGDINALE
ncbi:hypothetical protein SARC_16751 [Sphaeroforma arctica JP610]|uniref:Uncharacterized protein n=1 Tax=Sphaeroforma arctica JP610 TaxID=667725 RepID=A0A0L0F3G6_9EUKA|nr:hypothetical protein SARC_16751 [Sphaeroforma arctica JP610]KNC70718.1 hypothetical protein SARC_16751 [Sphaeroforma arctica JP610]|eukprot:XP_014144620.1 hypothetical protein SARC_16751 [Sphaeroforma arctica JP610]